MASVNLGSVHGKLELDTSSWDSGVDSAKQKLAGIGVVSGEQSSKVTSSWEAVGQKMQSVGAQMSLAITTPLVLFGRQAINTAAEFDSTMRTIAAVGGIGEERLKELEKAAIEFGRRGVFSAQEVAQAMTDMVRDGLDPASEGFEKQAEAAHNLAAASGVELYDAQIALSNSMFNFGMTAEQAGEAADILANVLNKTQLEMEDIGASMSYVGPIAETAGLSFAQTAAAIGIMGQAGIKGSMAGTTLRRALINLQAPTDAQSEALQGLGVKIFDSEGKMKDFKTILEDFNSALYESHDVTVKVGGATKEQTKELGSYQKKIASLNTSIEKYNAGISGASLSEEKRKEKISALQKEIGFYEEKIKGVNVADAKYIKQTKTLTDEQRIQAVETIFGAQAVSGMLAVIEEGPGVFGEFTDAMSENGTAARIAEERQVGLSYAMNRLKSANFELSKSFGDALAPAVEKLAIVMEGVSRWFGDLDPKWQAAITAALGFAAAIGPILVFLGTLATWLAPTGVLTVGFGILSTAIGGLVAALGTVLAPALIVVAALAGMYLFFKHLSEVMNLVNGILNIFGFNLNESITPMQLIKDFLGKIAETIKNTLEPNIRQLSVLWGQLGESMKGLKPVWDEFLRPVLDAVLTFIGGVFIVGIVVAIGIITGFVNGLINAIEGVVQFVTGVVGLITGLFNVIKGIVTLDGALIIAGFGQMWKGIKDIFTGAIKAVLGAVWGFITGVIGFFQNLYDVLVGHSIVPDMINAIVMWFAQLPERIYGAIVAVIQLVKNVFVGAWNSLSGELSTWPGRLKSWGENLARAFVDGFAKLGEWIKEKVKAGLDAAKSLIQGNSPPKEGPFKEIDKWGENVASAWVEGFGSQFGQLSSLMDNAMPQPSFAMSSEGNGRPQSTTTITHSPQMTVQIGVYAGSEMEKREIARNLFEAYDDYQKGIGASING